MVKYYLLRGGGTGRVVDLDALLNGSLVDAGRFKKCFKTTTLPVVLTELLRFGEGISPATHWSASYPFGFANPTLEFKITTTKGIFDCRRTLARQWWNPLRAEFGANFDVDLSVETSNREFLEEVEGFLRKSFGWSEKSRKKLSSRNKQRFKKADWTSKPHVQEARVRVEEWLFAKGGQSRAEFEFCSSVIAEIGICGAPGVIEDAITVLHAEFLRRSLPETDWLDFLRSLLECKDHFRHEEIVHFLQWSQDPGSIDAIRRAIELKPELEYLGYDDYGAFYTQCFYALRDIGTDAAFDVIDDCLSSDRSDLSKAAIEFSRRFCFATGF